PSHNMQFIPYASFRNFRAVDTRDPSQPRFNQIDARGKAGLDSKFVFHDSLVLDTTINPDFAQVESDEPQNTINQRFEVFFPEKRPFFLENANFFGDTNIGVYRLSQLLFTDRKSTRLNSSHVEISYAVFCLKKKKKKKKTTNISKTKIISRSRSLTST